MDNFNYFNLKNQKAKFRIKSPKFQNPNQLLGLTSCINQQEQSPMMSPKFIMKTVSKKVQMASHHQSVDQIKNLPRDRDNSQHSNINMEYFLKAHHQIKVKKKRKQSLSKKVNISLSFNNQLQELSQQFQFNKELKQQEKDENFENIISNPQQQDPQLEGGIQSQKNIVLYDVWEPEIPDDKLTSLIKDQKGPHARTPCYNNRKYEWMDVDVLEYLPDEKKFKIKLSHNGEIKKVIRLSLIFNIEDPEKFQIRLNVAKNLMEKAQNENKIQNILKTLNDDDVSDLNQGLLKGILKKTIKQNVNQNLTDEIKNIYKNIMKKLLLQKISFKQPEKFRKVKINLFSKQNKSILYGTIKQEFYKQNYEFKFYQENLRKLHICNEKQVVKMLNKFIARSIKFQDNYLFITNFSNYSLPMDLEKFETLQKNFLKENMVLLNMQWREYMVSEIQHILKNTYQFYLTINEEYDKNILKRILKRVDFMFGDYIRNNVFFSNIDNWCNFLEKYNEPSQNQYPWNMSNQNLIKLNICCQIGKKNDELNTKAMSMLKNSQFKKEYINCYFYLDPPINKIIDMFKFPILAIQECCEKFMNLEKDLVPLIDLERKNVFSSNLYNTFLQKSYDFVEQQLKYFLLKPTKILMKFNKYQYILDSSTKQIIKNIFGDSKERLIIDSLNIEEISEQLIGYEIAKKEIIQLSVNKIKSTIFEINTQNAKEVLLQKIQDIMNKILERVNEICQDNVLRIIDIYTELYEKISQFPKNEKELISLNKFLLENKETIRVNQKSITIIKDFLDILENYLFQYDGDQLEKFWSLQNWPSIIQNTVKKGQITSQTQTIKFQEGLEIEKQKFTQQLINLQNDFDEVKKFDSYEKQKEYLTITTTLKEKLEFSIQQVNSFNEREQLLNQPQSEYSELILLQNLFKPFSKIWDLVNQYDYDHQDWLNGNFLRLDYSIIDKKIKSYSGEALQIQNKFESLDQRNALKIVVQLQKDIESFKEQMWIIEYLTTEVMVKKPVYWKEVFEKTKAPIQEVSDDMSLRMLADMGMFNYRDIIEDISKKLDKQYSLEKKLNEMIDNIRKLNIGTQQYKNTFVLSALDDTLQQLEENFNVLIFMKSSPHIKPILKRANDLEQRLLIIQETLDSWMKLQRSWKYLEPIFISDDIKKKMPLEYKKFESVDKSYKIIMLSVSEMSNLWENIDSDKMKNDFDQNNRVLDSIQKSLNEYLETKRKSFPRFFFLSDDQLLEILAQTKDPSLVQRHVNKCFEAINLLQFYNQSEVSGMISPENEKVEFCNHVNVVEGEKNGNVEKWLFEIEQIMRKTLSIIAKKALKDTTPRLQWIFNYPAMTVLMGDKIFWTKETEEIIIQITEPDQRMTTSEKSQKLLTNYAKDINNKLQEIVKLVRGDLNVLNRQLLGALIVIDVHNRDIVNQLIKSNIQSIQEFGWVSQMKYYYEIDELNNLSVQIKCINAIQNYMFEYLGNSTRLVITPLTDRCYRTLLGAYQLNYGGAPEGPAGTGKTETTKDLAKAIAVQCVVFNCSEQLNFQSMRKFFKGLSASGAWCCLDEFNRIDVEVLSVIAQQVQTIQAAKRELKSQFNFDGDEVQLIRTCNFNVTMNPTYAGRSELPDNLKALFRTVAMMIPDYVLIAEIFLYSVGYQDATNIARKMVASMKLSSEQLSSQFHYDFGMRSLKAILNAAGELKRKMDIDEDKLALMVLQDVNLPKFTLNDIPLFLMIVSDLFPGIELPQRQYDQLIKNLEEVCDEYQWVPKDDLIKKCIQLQETIQVRHGLMIVGEAQSGKSMILECLKAALNRMDNNKKIIDQRINPKSITIYQLYGIFDSETKSWIDGVVPRIMREFVQTEDNNKWIIFDGPVDATWIENMNTVLDDNRKLCLTSGEIIKIINGMTIIFEVEDLQYASPATVSRCGMVFLETKSLGWKSVLKVYFMYAFPESCFQYKANIEKLAYICFEMGLEFILLFGSFPMTFSEVQIVQTFINLLTNYFMPFKVQNAKIMKDFEEIYQNAIIFSIIWSLGAILQEMARPKFNQFIISLVSGKNITQTFNLKKQYEPLKLLVKMNEQVNVFDVYYERKQKGWINWMQTQNVYKLPQGGQMQHLIIPTIDSIRTNFLMNLFIENKQNFLVTGPTGTGKTVNITNELNQNYFNDQFSNLINAFSGQTTSNQVQKTIESKMTTKRRKGRFGPEDSKDRIIIFIDDFNMPHKEKYTAQPPLEILRQQMDLGGWYDLDSKEWKYLEDITFIASMGPPSQGRNQVSLRVTRHFNLLYVEPFQANSLKSIFMNIMEWFFQNTGNQLNKYIFTFKERIVQTTIQIYNIVKSSKELLPTPKKSHYTYNLRDIGKVFQGIGKGNHLTIKNENDFLRLWAHECKRVFQDRLIDQDDQDYFDTNLKNLLKENFNKDWKILVQRDEILFASFVPTIYPDGDTTQKPLEDLYCELIDFKALKDCCYDKLNQYNLQYQGDQLDLVLFMNAIRHILRIIRIIQNPLGNALIVGVGGSGRKSLATLSCYIAQYSLFQVDVKNWIDELQKLLKLVGLESKNVVFLFSDNQVIKESMYEDISNLLNNGEVPNLFPIEEKAKIVEEVSNFMPTGTVNQKYQYFVNRCKEKLRLIMCMSPIGDSFRRRIRTFPGLVNCTTIDWFLPWPEEALISTAQYQISKVFLEGSIDEQNKLRKNIVDVCVFIQNEIKELTVKLYQEYRRYYYITPISYLDFLATFNKLNQSLYDQMQEQIERYNGGLTKLKNTDYEVQSMQRKLESLQPILEDKNKKNSLMLIKLQQKQEEASQQKSQCEIEEKQTNIQKIEAIELRKSCEEDLQKVLPLLDDASKALEKIKQEDITLIRSFTSPPPTLDLLMQAVCVTLGEDNMVKWKNKDTNDPSKGKEQDFWEYAKRCLLNNKLIHRIQSYREDKIKNMNPKSVEKVKKIATNTMFQKEQILRVSEPAYNMSLWIRAMIETYDALQVVEPKRKQLAEAEKKLQMAIVTLEQKQNNLKSVLQLLLNLEADYQRAIQEKEDLEIQVNTCAQQLDRAEKLIKGLEGQKINWEKKSKKYFEDIQRVIGDTIICAAFIAYLGPFIMSYRDNCVVQWQRILQEKQISMNTVFQLQDILSDDKTVGQWIQQQRLPNDRFSIQNAIILKNSSRWPLMIDPQLQANIWIKEMIGKQNIKVIQQTSMSTLDTIYLLENAIFYGQSCLLENIQENIDPIFEDILNKKLIKKGNIYQFKFQEKVIDLNPNFKFFITTKLANPHYSPEVCVKVNLLNFMVTPDGLEDQMLNIVVKIEEPVKEEQKEKNVREFFDNMNKQQMTEDKILEQLSDSKGNILDDEELILTLQTSQIESLEIAEKLKQLEISRRQFRNLQNFYKDVAKRAANLYFVVTDLALIEPVYQFSLEFYIEIFEKAVEKTQTGKVDRIKNINNTFTKILFESIIRSLIEKDKLTFSLMICLKILQMEKRSITLQEIRFFSVGGLALNATHPNPGQPWLSDKQWASIQDLSKRIPAYAKFDEDFAKKIDKWKQIYMHKSPYNAQESQWPQQWIHSLNSFQKLLIIRILRLDKLISAIQHMIIDQMDKYYIEFPPLDLNAAYDDSSYNKPIIFVLQTGADPRLDVEQLAKKKEMHNKLITKSMGQGQGDSAYQLILEAQKLGRWVFLQNCHLAASFMTKLEQIFENLDEDCHKDFRLLLTTAPFKLFPVTILQKGIKITYEPPKGIKNSLKRSYQNIDPLYFESCQNPAAWKKLLFGLSFFHALVLERRKFGPLGWNVPYEFSTDDLSISILQLRQFLDEYDEIQWPALNYMVAEANYGGRVTDDNDRSLIKVILKRFYCPDTLVDNYQYSQSNIYYCPTDGTLESYKNYISQLPLVEYPEIFGMHENAQINAAIIESNNICNTVLSLLPRQQDNENETPQEIIKKQCNYILNNLPKYFDIIQVKEVYPIQYEQCMNTVLIQEVIRYQNVLETVSTSIDNLILAIDGKVIMSSDLEEVFNSMFDNKVPQLWHRVSYPSLKPLGSWIINFIDRLEFINKWIQNGQPSNYWITGFFFTQSFFTGILQNYSRKYQISIDILDFDQKCISRNNPEYDVNVAPENGCYIYGLFIEGCQWNDQLKILDEQEPKKLFESMVQIYFIPIKQDELSLLKQNKYSCPVYKTSIRKGELSSTGHSTNYILSILLPIGLDYTSDFWIQRGVAMITQLDD